MAHVRSRVQAGHPIVGSQVHVCTVLFHQVLSHMQVPLLAGQIQGGGTHTCLVVHTPELSSTETTSCVT